jgi:hypothetical protein
MRLTAALALAASNERQIVDKFRAERAVAVPASRKLRDLGLNDSKALRQLVTDAVLRKACPDRYYLDEQVWANRRGLRGRTIARIAIALGLAVAAVAVYLLET